MGQIQINIRIPDDLKESAEAVLNRWGFGLSDAFNIFLRAVVMNDGLSFIPWDIGKQSEKKHDEKQESSSALKKYSDFATAMEERVKSQPEESRFSVPDLFSDEEWAVAGKSGFAGNLGRYMYKKARDWDTCPTEETKPTIYLKVSPESQIKQEI